MKKSWLCVLALTFGALLTGAQSAKADYWYGYYVPDRDESTGLTSFEKVTLSVGATWGDTVAIQGTISKTSSAGVTKLNFTYVHPKYGRQTVKWSGKIYNWDIPEFSYGGHRYWICFDAVPLGMQVCVDQDTEHEIFFWGEVHLAGGTVPVPTKWQKARTLKGAWGEGCGESADGTCELKCGKANKSGYAKVSLKITPFNGKAVSYSATSVYVGGSDSVTANFKNQYAVTIYSDDSFFGEPVYTGGRPSCSPNAVWDATVGGNIADGTHHLKVGREGLDGFEAFDCDKWGMAQGWSTIFDSGDYCLNGGLLTPYSVDGQSCSVFGSRFDFGKIPTLKYQVYRIVEDYGQWWESSLLGENDSSKPNTSAMKVTYNSRTGLFKGTFYVYTDPIVCVFWETKPPTKLKKYKITLNGAFVDGVGVGYAVSKKPSAGPWPVAIW